MDSEFPSTLAVAACRDQFNSSYRMLCTLVEVCPDSVWSACYYGFPYPVWYQVYHVAFFVDYWFRESYDGSEYRSMVFDERIAPEYEHEVPAGVSISREEMKAYLERIAEKLERFFGALTDECLSQPIVPGQDRYTYLDVIASQIRHVMYNVGYLNGILRGLDLPESDWYAYNEDEP